MYVCELVLSLTFFLCIRLGPAGENSQFVEGVVLAGPVPQPVQKAPPSASNRTHTDAGWQLVQKPSAEGSRCVGQKQVTTSIHYDEKQAPEVVVNLLRVQLFSGADEI